MNEPHCLCTHIFGWIFRDDTSVLLAVMHSCLVNPTLKSGGVPRNRIVCHMEILFLRGTDIWFSMVEVLFYNLNKSPPGIFVNTGAFNLTVILLVLLWPS